MAFRDEREAMKQRIAQLEATNAELAAKLDSQRARERRERWDAISARAPAAAAVGVVLLFLLGGIFSGFYLVGTAATPPVIQLPERVPPLPLPESLPEGPLTPSVVPPLAPVQPDRDGIVRQLVSTPGIRECWNRMLREGAELPRTVRVQVDLTVSPGGATEAAAHGEDAPAELRGCIEGAIEQTSVDLDPPLTEPLTATSTLTFAQ